MQKSSTLQELETSLICPMFDYRDVHHYYQDASCATNLHSVTTPLLCINARDDPIAPSEGIPFNTFHENENLALAVTESGGHLGWCVTMFADMPIFLVVTILCSE